MIGQDEPIESVLPTPFEVLCYALGPAEVDLPHLPRAAGPFWARPVAEWCTCYVGEDEDEYNFVLWQGKIYRA